VSEQPDANTGTTSADDPQAPRVTAPNGAKAAERSGRSLLSYALFAFAAILFAVAAFMYLREDDNDSNAIPSAQAGNNQLGHVVNALKNEGLETEYGKSADRAIGVTEVAQSLIVDGTPIYVFIYPDPAQRERDQQRLDPAALQIVNTRGTPVAEGTPQIIGGSNVLVAVYSDNPGLIASITAAIEGLA
jgi:hypothetical protein